MKEFALLFLLLTGTHQLVQVGPPDPHYCDHEAVLPNLHLETTQAFEGYLRDQTGAPFKKIKVELKWSDSHGRKHSIKQTTDADGKFEFPPLDAGQYRFLAAPSRAFQQPALITCSQDESVCRRDVTLIGNGTDMPYSQCPLK